MKRSTDRILTTHVGSLPRPGSLLDLLEFEERGLEFDREALRNEAAATVKDIVARQVASGIDVVSDGEMSKIGYTFYVKHRLAGIGQPDGLADPGAGARVGRDLQEHPDFLNRTSAQVGQWIAKFERPFCIGPVAYADRQPLENDLANLAAAVKATTPVEAFMNAASPGVPNKIVTRHFFFHHNRGRFSLRQISILGFQPGSTHP